MQPPPPRAAAAAAPAAPAGCPQQSPELGSAHEGPMARCALRAGLPGAESPRATTPDDTERLGWANCIDGWDALDEGRLLLPPSTHAQPKLRQQPPPPAGRPSGAVLRVNNSLHSSHGLSDWASSITNGAAATWYACGPTVYDSAHLGHARTYISFDIIRRVLEDYFHHQVHMVMGVTDVDDKIIIRTRQINELVAEGWEWERARAALAQAPPGLDAAALTASARAALEAAGAPRTTPEMAQLTVPGGSSPLSGRCPPLPGDGKDAPAGETAAGAAAPAEELLRNDGLDTAPLTREMERRFWSNMERLGVGFPRAVVRVTEHIAEIIHFCEVLIQKGYAYENAGSVYFNTEQFRAAPAHQYAKLVPSAADDAALAQDGEGLLSQDPGCFSEKRNRRDFALWKASRPEEPRWRSPWGYGRPGWHIECAAMASHVLGERIDIHTGGEDLKFPHHDNELASAEAYWGHSRWVGVFLHSGHLHIDGRKMAKSLRNFISIDAALEKYTPAQLRWLFLLHHYDAPMMFGCNSMGAALREEEHWLTFFAQTRSYLRKVTSPCASGIVQRWGRAEETLSRHLSDAQRGVHDALCENFNTPLALARLRDLARLTREYIRERDAGAAECGVRLLLLRAVDRYCRRMLGLFGVPPDAGARAAADADAAPHSPHDDDAPPGGVAGGDAGRAAALDLLVAFRAQVRGLAQRALRPGGGGAAVAEELLRGCDALRDAVQQQQAVRIEDTQWASRWRDDVVPAFVDPATAALLAAPPPAAGGGGGAAPPRHTLKQQRHREQAASKEDKERRRADLLQHQRAQEERLWGRSLRPADDGSSS